LRNTVLSLIPNNSDVWLASKPASATNNTDKALRNSIAVIALSLSARALAISSPEKRAVLAMEHLHGNILHYMSS
jgi:hypothetical protein